MPRKKIPANVVGPKIGKARTLLGLTQEEFAVRCQLAGLDISRSTLGQIESRLRYVCDMELITFASLLGTTIDALVPEAAKRRFKGKKIRPRLRGEKKKTGV